VLSSAPLLYLPSYAAADGRELTARRGVEFSDQFAPPLSGQGPRMVTVGACRFIMGSRPEELGFSAREARHEVKLSAFAIGKFEVSNEDFCRFLNAEGNRKADGIPWALIGNGHNCRIRFVRGIFSPDPGYARYPVVAVSWLGARAYCRWLTARTGRSYDLPTEAQWECAARAGTSTDWDWGDSFQKDRLNWRKTRHIPAAMPVGSFPPNHWGICDMLGNVWEWALDKFTEDAYELLPASDPVMYDDDNWTPVIRGGSFHDSVEFCRPGFRADLWWWGDYDNVGFRVACDVPGN